jgi:putative SOS response-associated peptidase YedK
MKWGLVPSWSENDSTGTHPINARCETIESKPMFSRLFKNKRCVVIADGYFEWEKRPDGKQPYFHRFFQPADIKNENFKHEQKMKETKIKQEPSSSQQTQDTGVYSISKPITFGILSQRTVQTERSVITNCRSLL